MQLELKQDYNKLLTDFLKSDLLVTGSGADLTVNEKYCKESIELFEKNTADFIKKWQSNEDRYITVEEDLINIMDEKRGSILNHPEVKGFQWFVDATLIKYVEDAVMKIYEGEIESTW